MGSCSVYEARSAAGLPGYSDGRWIQGAWQPANSSNPTQRLFRDFMIVLEPFRSPPATIGTFTLKSPTSQFYASRQIAARPCCDGAKARIDAGCDACGSNLREALTLRWFGIRMNDIQRGAWCRSLLLLTNPDFTLEGMFPGRLEFGNLEPHQATWYNAYASRNDHVGRADDVQQEPAFLFWMT